MAENQKMHNSPPKTAAGTAFFMNQANRGREELQAVIKEMKKNKYKVKKKRNKKKNIESIKLIRMLMLK